MECPHFWSAIDTTGHIQCAWCGEVRPAPVQWVSDTTVPASQAFATQEKGNG